MTDSTLATSIGFVYFDLKHECQTQATRVQHERHKCDTSDRDVTQVTQVRHEAKSLILVTIREKMFSNPYISSMSNEELHGEEHFPSKNYLLEMSRSHAKMRLKSAP